MALNFPGHIQILDRTKNSPFGVMFFCDPWDLQGSGFLGQKKTHWFPETYCGDWWSPIPTKAVLCLPLRAIYGIYIRVPNEIRMTLSVVDFWRTNRRKIMFILLLKFYNKKLNWNEELCTFDSYGQRISPANQNGLLIYFSLSECFPHLKWTFWTDCHCLEAALHWDRLSQLCQSLRILMQMLSELLILFFLSIFYIFQLILLYGKCSIVCPLLLTYPTQIQRIISIQWMRNCSFRIKVCEYITWDASWYFSLSPAQ